jgi:hydroxyethylthiazole kinase-like uncharacterized protein yjeF
MTTHPIGIYQTAQIRTMERLAIEQFAISGQTLMQRAGLAAFNYMQQRWPQARKIAVLAGAGNNGGDGYVVARLARERGLQAKVWQIGDHAKLKAEALEAYQACAALGVPIHVFDEKEMGHPDIIVDAICGIGLHGSINAEVSAVIEKIQQLHLPIFSLDIPTGIDADTGQVLGRAIRATATMTFIGFKLGLLTGQGRTYVGELICDDLQLPTELCSTILPIAKKIERTDFASYLAPRARNWHKGLSGHVLIVGGDQGFSGAPRMAGEAALRVGAGLVTLATQPEHASLLNVCCPELMCHGIADIKELHPLIEKADVIVLGPGLGRSAWSRELWAEVVRTPKPLLIDADGLNLLAEHHRHHENWILTPHPGEAARLLQITIAAVEQDRLTALHQLQKKYGGAVVLKGAGSLVLGPHTKPTLCDKGNPGMATAGMGDVLSGVIAGWLAQGLPLADAAEWGVYMHALAGDMAAQQGGERGLMAMDLMPYLRQLSNVTDR